MDKLLKDTLKEQMQAKGWNAERLAIQTGIPERHIVSLIEDRREHLPAQPYVRGYIMKLASLLELDGMELWNLYKNDVGVKSSGPLDRLPENRFALKKINKRHAMILIAATLVVIYAGANVDRFIGKPKLEITSPASDTVITSANSIELLGRIDIDDNLTIDGEPVRPDSDGKFSFEYALKPGVNRVEFVVKKLLGKETTAMRQIIYQPELLESIPGR